jgi:predicted secreted protein
MRRLCLCLLTVLSFNAFAADTPRKGIVVELSAEASQSAPNDQGQATAFMEAEAATPAEAARKVNTAIAQALAICKQSASVQSRSGHTWTNPVYGKSGRNIEGWHMRSEIVLESRDLPALAEVLTKLQATLGVSQLNLQPAAETRTKTEERATVDAIEAFRAKAKLIASRMGSDYRIVQIQVQGGSNRMPVYPMKAMALRADSAMPIEAGESQVTVSISGQIEILP